MTLEEAKRKLYDTTFLLGRFRRRAAIRELAAMPEPAGVLILAAALGQSHPSSGAIVRALQRLSPEQDADQVTALWGMWGQAPQPALAGVLVKLGWPPGRAVEVATARGVLAAATGGAVPEVLRVVTVFLEGDGLRALVAAPDPAGVLILAEALGRNPPCAPTLLTWLRGLSPARDADKLAALWRAWAAHPQPALAGVLVELGWPPGQPVEAATARAGLAAAAPAAGPAIQQAVVAFARSLPVTDEALNDAVYLAWLRTQSNDLEQLLIEPVRPSASLALEALHALVTGQVERYAALRDEDGSLLAQAFAMAPPPFRARIARTVAGSPDRRLKEAYRRALVGGGLDDAQSVASLKLVGDEDGLFEKTKSLRLGAVLDLCERWADNDARPSRPDQRAVVDRAVTAFRSLGQFKVEPGSELPEGLVDLFAYWRRQKPSDADLRTDLQAEDPFRKARGLYLGHERGLVDRQRLATAAKSEHWPERLVARLDDTTSLAEAREDHVLWVSVCAGDDALLQTPIGGTPEDYARHSDLLGKVRGAAVSRTRALLEIVCAFQGAFVASGITIDETAEATERTAVEIEDAGPVEF